MPARPKPTTKRRLTGSALAEDVRAAAMGVPFDAPRGLPPEMRSLWDDVVAAKHAGEWRRADRVIVAAYIRCWQDIAELHKQLETQPFAMGSKVNPLVLALGQRLAHASNLHRTMGLLVPRARTDEELTRMHKHRGKVERALSALDDEDDGLLARPIQ